MNFYSFGKAISYPILRCIFKVRYEGLEHIPQGGGYILACNHRSGLDPLFIAHKVPVQIHYLAKSELIKTPIIGFIIKSLGVIPINRGKGDTGALEKSAELVQNGKVLGVFPEGHRSKNGAPLRPRSGISIIAGKTQADILPVALSYGKGLRFRSLVTVRYGPLIPNADTGINLTSPSTLRAASKFIMDEIVSLMDPMPGQALPPEEEEKAVG